MPPAPDDPIWMCGGVEYETTACSESSGWADDCEDPPQKDPGPVFSLVRGTPFQVVAGPSCSTVGRTQEELRESAITALELTEQKTVERAFWTGELGNYPSLAGGCCDESPGSPGETSPGDADECCADGTPCCRVLNAAGADGPVPLSLAAAVMQLEEYAGNHYAGVPIIHAPRGVSAFAAANNLLCVCGNGANTTPVGTRWAFYAGSPNTGPCGVPAPPCTAWMYVTGRVRIYRSDITTVPPQSQLEQGITLRRNQQTVIAERTYVLTRECLCAAVLVEVACASC